MATGAGVVNEDAVVSFLAPTIDVAPPLPEGASATKLRSLKALPSSAAAGTSGHALGNRAKVRPDARTETKPALRHGNGGGVTHSLTHDRKLPARQKTADSNGRLAASISGDAVVQQTVLPGMFQQEASQELDLELLEEQVEFGRDQPPTRLHHNTPPARPEALWVEGDKDTPLDSTSLNSASRASSPASSPEGDKGTKVQADALAKNSVLTNFELADNGIGDKGAKGTKATSKGAVDTKALLKKAFEDQNNSTELRDLRRELDEKQSRISNMEDNEAKNMVDMVNHVKNKAGQLQRYRHRQSV